jgi:hypothetical protein
LLLTFAASARQAQGQARRAEKAPAIAGQGKLAERV